MLWEHRRGDNELPFVEVETSEPSLEGGIGAGEEEGISAFLEETACAKARSYCTAHMDQGKFSVKKA